MQGNIIDMLMAPLSPMELTAGCHDSRLSVGLGTACRARFKTTNRPSPWSVCRKPLAVTAWANHLDMAYGGMWKT